MIFLMNKLLLTGALWVALASVFMPVNSVLAVAPPANTGQGDSGLVPCGYGDEYDCGTDDAITLANNVIDFLIKMLAVVAVIALVYAGFKLVTSAGNESAWREAKSLFTSIVIGIIIILSAFLVVDTILKALTDKGLEETSGGIVNTGSN